MFQPCGVEQVHDEVDHRDQCEVGREEPGSREADHQDGDGRNAGCSDGQLARGNGAVAFLGVLAVAFYVGDVVEDVHRAGEQAEDDHAPNGDGQGIDVRELPVKNNGSQDKDILGPLLGPHGF